MSQARTGVNGLHHVTAIAGPAQRNLDFWAKTLGLRFVKKTVNFDDPGTYHLYYGDGVGHPGTIMTFFPWEGVVRGQPGTGETGLTQLAVPEDALAFWKARLDAAGVTTEQEEMLFGEHRLIARDPDGIGLAFVEVAEDGREPWTTDEIGADVAIRGFHGVTLNLADAAGTGALLEGLMNYEKADREGATTRYVGRGDSDANIVDIVEENGPRAASMGAGSVHHVAFAVEDDATQKAVRQTLVDEGLNVTPVIDRNYFHSIYFRSPGGVLFEIATNTPGFDVDEPVETLGEALKLPRQHEHLRALLEEQLPKLVA